MAPKKDPKKKGKDDAPEGPTTLYQRREPLQPLEQPDVTEASQGWKKVRGMYMMPLPEWDAKAVDTLEWKPTETESRFTAPDYSAKTLPKSFAQGITTWRRAAWATDPSAAEEPEPEAQPLPEVDEEPPPPDPKAKAKAKADPKAKAKSKGGKDAEPEGGEKPTTAQQFADIPPSDDDLCVVTMQEFRTREFTLTSDESLPPMSQAIASQFAVIGEHKHLFPSGTFLWELIHPQNEDGVPLYNPHGKYVVRLFLMGTWRQVAIDDVVPVGAGDKGGCASLLPASHSANVLWPMLLTKALLSAFQADLTKSPMVPVITALTGWLPYEVPLSWDSLSRSHSTRPFCCVQMQSTIDPDGGKRDNPMASSPVEPERRKVNQQSAPVPSLNLMATPAPPAVPVPKLAAPPNDGVPLQFLVCEVEADPPQVRVKSATWRPAGSTPRKTVIKEADSETGDPDEPPPGPSPELDSEPEDMDEDDDGGRSQRSPSGGEPGERSARSKEEAEPVDESPKGEENPEAEAAADNWMPPWPDAFPQPPLLTSWMQEHHRDLIGGFWMSYDTLQASSETFTTFLPPTSQILRASLNSTWADGRKEAYIPTRSRLLTMKLVSSKEGRASPLPLDEKDVAKGPQWIRAIFVYEPLKVDPSYAAAKKDADTQAGPPMGCLLQALESWGASASENAAPSYIHLVAGEGVTRGSVAVRSLLLPPGEHSYLVFDDAAKAGSVLSVYVDADSLNTTSSSISFGPPHDALDKRGIPVVALEQTEYPAQSGFNLWTKAEVVLSEDAAAHVDFMQLLSFVSDPTLRPYLQVTFVRLVQEPEDALPEPSARCAGWSVQTLVRAPLLRLMAVPLAELEPGKLTKYVVMVEACVPTPMPGGQYSLDMILPQYHRQQAEDSEEPGPLSVTTLPVESRQRWMGETTANDKGLVICERLTVPMGGGDVSAMLRFAVADLPGAFIRATLVAQLPPKEETRFRPDPEAPPPEPLAPGAPIDPRDYGGRNNWLSRCQTVAEESGPEVALFPHIVLCEGATYLLYVKLDPFRGPDKLEGGSWLLELIGSGEVEAGRDTMEEDLEELKRRSWVEKDADPNQPTRQERAAASRKRWLQKHRREADGEGVAADSEQAATSDQEKELGLLEGAKARAKAKTHTNTAIKEFVRWHTDEEAVLTVQDPYIVAKDPPLGSADESTEAEDAAEEDAAAARAARYALGMEGLREERLQRVEEWQQRWEETLKSISSAKEANTDGLADLKVLQEERLKVSLSFEEKRTELKEAFAKRFQKQSDLKETVANKERVDVEKVKEVLASAKEHGVEVWSPELVAQGEAKLRFLEALAALRAAAEAAQAEPPADDAARAALGEVLAEAKDSLQALTAKSVPLSSEMGVEELVAKVEELVQPPEAEEA